MILEHQILWIQMKTQILPCVSPEFLFGAKYSQGIGEPTIKTFKYFC